METEQPPKSRRPVAKWVAILLLLIIVIVVLLWYFVFRDTSPADVNSQAAKEARDEALSEAGTSDVQSLDGVWIVDTEIGEFNDACLTEVCGSSFAGFRIDEELVGIGGKTVVGRTPDVSAQFTINGSEIVSSSEGDRPTVTVDMTTLDQHPAKRGEKKIMESERHSRAEERWLSGIKSSQEEEVGEEEGEAEVAV